MFQALNGKNKKLFDSTQNDLHFLENCILFFPSIICVFLDKKPNSKLVSEFEQKDTEFLQKLSEKFQKLHSTSPRKQWERIDCLKKVHSGYWAKNGRICEKFKSFSFKIEQDDHQFLTEKMSTGLRICNRGVRVWSGRFQTFSENIRGDCENCIHRSFSGCFFHDKNFFIRTVLRNCRKTFKRLIDFPPDWRNCILFVQRNNLKWFFWRKSNLTSFFEVWMENFLNFVEKLSAGREVFFCGFGGTNWELFLKNFILNLIWNLSTCFRFLI